MSFLGTESRIDPIVLSDEEQSYLKALAGNTDAAKTISDRCRVILRCADGLKDAEVAAEFGWPPGMVRRWRHRFQEHRIKGLLDKGLMGNEILPADETAAESRDSGYGKPGSRPKPVVLSDEERSTLENYVRNPDASASVAVRCRIILRCADGMDNGEVAKELCLNPVTVRRWRNDFVKSRLNALLGKRKTTHFHGFTGEKSARNNEGNRHYTVGPRLRITLSEDERVSLESLVRNPRGTGTIADRSRAILRCADAVLHWQVAEELGVCAQTVARWRRTFLKGGIRGLLDKPSTGLDLHLTGEKASEVIDRTLNTTPAGATHWTEQAMADATGLPKWTIRRMWTAFGVHPQPWTMLELCNDRLFVEQVRDIVGLYLSPPLRALVLSVEDTGDASAGEPGDETRRTQALDGAQPGRADEWRSPDRTPVGTNPLIIALDIVAGFVAGHDRTPHGLPGDVHDFLEEIHHGAPGDLNLHIVVDNALILESAEIGDWMARRPRWHAHVAPAPAAWTHQLERWLDEMARRPPQPGATGSAGRLEADIRGFLEGRSDTPRPFKWLGFDGDNPGRRSTDNERDV